MYLIFARHAETESTSKDIFSGLTDSPLTERGKQQAQMLGKYAKYLSVKKIISSPLKRALKTAKIAGKIAGQHPLIDERLKEICYGEWDRVKKEKLIKLPEWTIRKKNLYRFIHPGTYKGIKGESYEMLYKRVTLFFESLKQEKEFPVLIVSHVGVVRCAMKYFENLPDSEFPSSTLPNHNVYTVKKQSGKILTQTVDLNGI